MSFLKTSLEKRIKELHASIEAQKTELAAYEQVLALETGKPAGLIAAPPSVAAVVSHHAPTHKAAPHKPVVHKAPVHKPAPPKAPAQKTVAPAASPMAAAVEFNGSRSDYVVALLKHRGSAGITPPEISAAFRARKIAIGKNLVYNVLSLMFKQKRVRKSDGRYYLLGGSSPAAAAPAKAAAPAPPAAAKKKSRISEEGMRRIIAATKKRWARERAAQGKGR